MNLRWKIPIISPAVYAIWKMDAARKYDMIEDWMGPEDKLLEIGSGPGSILEIFRMRGHYVTGLDIGDNSYSDDLKATIYDGEEMPFTDGHFDTALLLTMLHHTPDPDVILREAARVAKRLIIIEDVYDTPFQAAYTKLTDSFTNLEFAGHPHSNRSNDGWITAIEQLGLKLRFQQTHRFARIYQQAVYVADGREAV